jgi:hypothetical protein
MLPTKEYIFKRKIVPEKGCPIYIREDELAVYILWNCPSAQGVWGCGPIRFQKTCGMGKSFWSLFEELRKRCTIDELELMAVVTCKIWLCRNTFIHGGLFKPHWKCLIMEAQASLEEFQKENTLKLELLEPSPPIQPAMCATPPRKNQSKLGRNY